LKATLASASTPYYFKPAEVLDGKLMFSGEYVAKSPALFAWLYANERNDIAFDKMRVLSIGNVNVMPEKIDGNTGLLDWASRLVSLSSPAKKHSHDYTLEHMMNHHGQKFFKIEIDISPL